MKYNDVYVVLCDGMVEYASTDKYLVEGYADSQNYNARQDVLDEWDIDDPSERNNNDADFKAGAEGCYYEVKKVNISGLTKDDVVELPEGDEIEVSCILEKLEAGE